MAIFFYLVALLLGTYGVWKLYQQNLENKSFFKKLGLILIGSYILIAGVFFFVLI
ncbi:hypothetical protein [Virgibacillus salexigens]|uniref:DUF3976 domain-containing protein n=1 Tax=Virgibacillus kapii TaxID=1638645 RepID=A0ABQ2D6A8_9BACI|nr:MULTISPECIES: hypothetical protein [Virgibacillus]MYL42110.1 hypothetical protein [Virgibacillus massiliensis]GGJ45477.1 hypothetical protein GCM10007111_04390 [Virgibacillus kapii]